MRFSVYEFAVQNPGSICPIRLRDPASGKIIANVIGFDTGMDSVSVLCSGDDGRPYRYVDYDKREEALVAQDIHMPFEVVDWYEGIDDEPTIKVHTITMKDGKVVGEWTPAGAMT